MGFKNTIKSVIEEEKAENKQREMLKNFSKYENEAIVLNSDEYDDFLQKVAFLTNDGEKSINEIFNKTDELFDDKKNNPRVVLAINNLVNSYYENKPSTVFLMHGDKGSNHSLDTIISNVYLVKDYEKNSNGCVLKSLNNDSTKGIVGIEHHNDDSLNKSITDSALKILERNDLQL